MYLMVGFPNHNGNINFLDGYFVTSRTWFVGVALESEQKIYVRKCGKFYEVTPVKLRE